MIVVVKRGASEQQIENLTNWFKAKGVEPDVSQGTDVTIIGLVGDVSKIDTELVEALDIVDSVKRVSVLCGERGADHLLRPAGQGCRRADPPWRRV